MSGDLSLSAALGGLRIANPDDNDTPPAVLQIDNASYEPDLNVISAPSIPQTTVHLQANPAARDIYDSPPSHNQLHRVRDSSPSSIHRSQQSRYRSSSDPRTAVSNSSQISRNPSTRTRNIDTAIPVSRPPYVREGSTASYNPNHLNYDPSYNRASASAPGQPGRPYSVSYAPTHVLDPRAGQSSQLSRAASQRGPHPHSMSGPQMAMDGQPPPRRSSRGVSQQGGAPNDGFGPGSSVPRTEQEWKDRGAVVGMKREIDAEGRPVMRPFKKGVSDFNFGQVLGEGSYSTVYYATDRQTLKDYAVKVLDKRHIIKEKKIKYVTIEKDTLNRLTEHPGVVRLYYTFQDQASLYFVLDLC